VNQASQLLLSFPVEICDENVEFQLRAASDKKQVRIQVENLAPFVTVADRGRQKDEFAIFPTDVGRDNTLVPCGRKSVMPAKCQSIDSSLLCFGVTT
jgi:hypothetical protein